MLDHPLFDGDSARIGAWVWLLARACWKPTPFDIGGKIVTLERGQLCVSRAQLAKAWGWSPSAVERFLTRLKTEQMIGQDTGQGRSIITICNYDKYQHSDVQAGQDTGQPTGQRSDSHRTTKEQGNKGIIEPIGSNNPLPRASKAKADRGCKLPDDFEPILTEAAAEKAERLGADAYREQLERFKDHHRSKGTVFTDWQAAFRTWLSKAAEWQQERKGRNGNGRSGNGGGQYTRGNGFFNAVYEEVSQRYKRDGSN